MKNLFTLILLIVSFFIISCSIDQKETIEVIIMENHPWERDDDLMWYKIEYFDGKEIKNMFLSSGQRRAELLVHKGKTVVVLARPLGVLNGAGGSIIKNKKIELKFENNKICSLFLEYAKISSESSSFLNLEKLQELIGSNYSENKVIDILISGEIDKLKSLKEEKPILVELEDIPTGWWFPETDEENVLVIKTSQTASLSLIPGVYRYYNFERNLMLNIAIDDNSEVFYQVKAFDIWY